MVDQKTIHSSTDNARTITGQRRENTQHALLQWSFEQ